MSRHRVRWLTLGIALLPLLAACGGDDDDTGTTAAADAGAGGGEITTVEVGAIDYAFQEAPAELAAGVVELTLDNQGEVAHEFALAEVGDATVDEFVAEFPAVLEGGPFPDFVGAVVAPLNVPAGESATATFTVTEGNYVVFCALTGDVSGTPAEGEDEAEGAPHFTQGMIQPITIAAGEPAADLPAADGTITAIDYAFDAEVSEGDQVINFVNDGPEQAHVAAIAVFPDGTGVEEAEASYAALLQTPPGEDPPEGTVIPEDLAYGGIASPGLGVQFEVPGGFEPERVYVVFCFLSDRAGGPPHAVGENMWWTFITE